MKNIISCLLFVVSSNVFGQEPRLVVPIGHTEAVQMAAFSANSKLFLTASADGTAKLWQVATGAMLAELKGHQSWFRAVGFVPGGKYIYTSADSIRIWNSSNATLHLTLAGKFPERTVYSFTPDGGKMISMTHDSVFLWNMETGTKLSATYYKDVNAASFSADGKNYQLSGKGGMLNIYTVSDGSMLHSFKANEKGVHDARFSPDGKMILITTYDNKIELWNPEGKLLFTLAVFKNSYGIADFSKDSRYVIGSEQNFAGIASTQIWNTANGVLTTTIKGHPNNLKISANNISPDGSLLVLPSRDGYQSGVHTFPVATNTRDLKGHTDYINYTTFSADGKYVATTSSDKTAKIYNADDGSLHVDLRGKSRGAIKEAVFSPGGKYFASNANGTFFIWRTKDGSLATEFHTNDEKLEEVRFSPNGKYLLTITGNNDVSLWNAETATLLIKNLKKDLPNVYVNYQGTFEFSADSKKLFISNHDTKAFIFETASGKLLSTMNHDWFIDRSAMSPDGNYAATLGRDTLRIWDAAKGIMINQFLLSDNAGLHALHFTRSGEKWMAFYSDQIQFFNLKDSRPYKTINDLRHISMTANKTQLLTADSKGIKSWNMESGKIEFEWEDPDMAIYGSAYFNCLVQDNYIVYNCSYSIKVIDMLQKKQLVELKNGAGQPVGLNFNADKTQLAVAYNNGIIRIWQLSNGTLQKEMTGQHAAVNNVYFIEADKKLLSVSADNIARIWEIQNGKLNYSFFALNNKDYFMQEPNGYYLCTQAAAKSLYYVTPDLNVISFNQLDIKYNRPDKVLEAIGNPDTALIRSYRRAYNKRIKKLSIDTTAFRSGFSVPEADFANRDKIEFEQIDGKLTLQVKGFDNAYKLDRFNIWVNETPLYGQRGISLRHKNKNSFDSTITIDLSEGANEIETSITNVNGTESYRMPLQVNYSASEKPTEKTYFIGIGIDQFANSKYNLQYSTKDIRDLSKKLKEKYKDIIIDTLFNEKVTISNVKALKQKLRQTSVNDKVIVSYSGHGMLSKDFDYYLSTYTVNFENPVQDGLPYEALESLLDSIPARKKLLLIDACHSGEVDKEEMEKLREMAISDTSKTKGAKGVEPLFTQNAKKLGMKNSFEMMQELFVQVGRSTGATIISAAAGTQFALERGDLKNGVFTYAILEEMKKNSSMKISELKKIVGLRVEELTKGLQKPTSRNEMIVVDWEVW